MDLITHRNIVINGFLVVRKSRVCLSDEVFSTLISIPFRLPSTLPHSPPTMLGSGMPYPHDDHHDSRPPKRPRNLSVHGDQPQHLSGPPVPMDDQGFTAAVGADNSRNSRSEMPQPPAPINRPRTDDKNNRKLSCKECRRLKLKCDRVFPCQSCVKRGCGSLCPEGALTSGRGSRFILANTEQLHEKIFELSERVRQLEDALEFLQSRCSNQPHPLLAPDLLKIKTSQELYGTMNMQPLQPPQPVASTSSSEYSAPARETTARDEYLRKSVGALSLNTQPPYAERSRPKTIERLPTRDSTPPEVGSDILQLSATFPFPWAVDVSIRKRIRDVLPPRDEAMRICEEARNNALWQFNIDASETFLPNLLNYCYATPIEALSPRRLALLLMHLSIGSLVDLTRPLGSLHGEAYHHLARAAVCEIPLMEEPDFDVLHALFFMIWYHLIFSDNKKAVGYAWNLMGFVAKLAQGLGLHRETPRLKVIPEEHEKRRAVFWELLNMDCRMALSLGRPPSIRLAHVDVRPPAYVGPGLFVPREEIVYHEWKNEFFIKCLTPLLEAMISVEPLDYNTIVGLDTSVRDFGVPSILDQPKPNDVSPRFLVMQRGLVVMGREIALLQLHRRYFTDAMSGPEPFDLTHVYAPSVLATYLSASNLISAVETLFEQEQQLSVRFLHFWFNTFSAAVTLSLLISRAPSTPLAGYAFSDLERAFRLFRAAAKILPFSGKSLPVMEKLLDKSKKVLMKSHTAESNRSYAGYPQPQPTLPPSFQNSHSQLTQYAERIAACSPLRDTDMADGSQGAQPPSDPAENKQEPTWLADIYHFASIGISIEERYGFASTRASPFVSSSPRIAENETFNFDHGALTRDLVEETSYMAWF
ncbi:unnamed protein product [Cyclocybe aegerita]|uniref:Zn(2)-C6 fungal-type domain-containing protein n=1 Tax=Cyclocybe aegerita TaxID=1973307 RepID=A0A8S0XR10_CYCAE|nr:unnamed protein product [Cyclocybe aegerita]